MAFGFAPKGWAQCNGQILPIAQNQALFSLLGTTYGGNGQTTFALPNLQSRVPIMFNGTYPWGAMGGEESHVLQVNEMPTHNHSGALIGTSTAGGSTTPTGNVLAGVSTNAYIAGVPNPIVLSAGSIGQNGSGQAHENRQPLLALNFCISMTGIFPSRN